MKGYKGLLVCTSAMLAIVAGMSAVQAAGERVIVSPVSPRDIADYKLPAGTVGSGGLKDVGLGEAINLEAQVAKKEVLPSTTPRTYTDVTVTDVTWNLLTKPANSNAVLGAPIMTAAMPIYEVKDRTLLQVAGRALLVPDAVGLYTVNAVVTTTEYGAKTTATITLSAGLYAGVGTVPTLTADGKALGPWTDTATTPQCGVCHKLDDRIAPWQGTLHATKLTREIADLVSIPPAVSHYSGNCISCHTVGYNKTASAINGGFDDVAAAQTPAWTFPATLGAASWNDMPAALKEKANIQCESCHGAGSEHGLTVSKSKIAVDYSVGVCAVCHDAGKYHVRPAEWRKSAHAITVGTQSPSNTLPYNSSDNCARCHTASGFVNFANPRWTIDPTTQQPLAVQRGWSWDPAQKKYVANPNEAVGSEAIGCSACHDPHSKKNPHQVRRAEDITLRNGEIVKDGELGKLCMACHQNRRDSEAYVRDLTQTRGPHHSVQGDILSGLNGVEFGQYIPSSSGHILATEDACATCHMQVLPATLKDGVTANPGIVGGVQQAGGHTWKMAWLNGATEVDETGICAECHGEQEDFDVLTRKDYDGNGKAEGIQTEVQNLLNKLVAMLPADAKNASGVPVLKTTSSVAVRSAVYNWMLVTYDGSMGVHNPQYVTGLLKASIAAIGGNTPATSGGPLGGDAVAGGWINSSWLGYYTPIFDGHWIFQQYHGPLYVNPNPALDGYVELWDPILMVWLRTTPILYPTVEVVQTVNGVTTKKSARFSRDPITGQRTFTFLAPDDATPALTAPGYSFNPAAGVNP